MAESFKQQLLNFDFKVKPRFKFLPAIVWCILIDVFDFLFFPITALLTFLGVTAIPALIIVKIIDIVQIIFGFGVFEGISGLAGGLPDVFLPQGFNEFAPSFTIIYLIKKASELK